MTRFAVLIAAALLRGASVRAEPVAVRQTEGVLHGFLGLSTLGGNAIADGDLTQVVHGERVTSRLSFRFRDGSQSEETTVFTQQGHFKLVSDHLVQQGPAFPHPMDVSIDGNSGQTTVRYRDNDGLEKTLSERLDLPADVANGLLPILLKNLRPEMAVTTVSLVAATPKLRIVKLNIRPVGEDPLTIGRTTVKAVHYAVKVDIGGVLGLLAPLVGKQPPDIHVWVLGGEAPAFVKMEGPFSLGGPRWRLELVSPVWPRAAASERN